jgi:hypothetical protein
MSAPRATLESGISFAPGSESTQRARSNLSRAEQGKSDPADKAPAPSNSN